MIDIDKLEADMEESRMDKALATLREFNKAKTPGVTHPKPKVPGPVAKLQQGGPTRPRNLK